MSFLEIPVPAPVELPTGPARESSVYTGTACLALMDTAVTAEVWEDLLYDGVDHDHGAGGLMLNSAAVGTHLEHDGEFPVHAVLDAAGFVVGFRVNLDPYGEDLSDVRALGHDDPDHDHTHSHGAGHAHSHPHSHDADDHGHGDGHGEGWSTPESVRLVSNTAVFGDPAGLPEADDTGDLIEFTFPSGGGELLISVYTEHGLRRELVALWRP